MAKLAGVSRTTVSLVLNSVAGVRIPQETRDRIHEAARELNYVAHHSAKSLATGRTGRISFVTSSRSVFLDETNYISSILAGVMRVTVHSDYDVILHGGPGEVGNEMAQVLLGDVSDGALLVGRSTPDALAETLTRAHFPFVSVSYHQPGIAHWVDCDNEGGGRIAAEHLWNQGHQRVAALYSPGTPYMEERLTGVKRYVEDMGGELLVFSEGVTPSVMRQKLRDENCSAIVLTNELAGIEMLIELKKLGVTIPEDLAAITFDSTPQSSEFNPPLTSIRQPLTQIGFQAARTLVDLIAGNSLASTGIRLPVSLDVRSSTPRVKKLP